MMTAVFAASNIIVGEILLNMRHLECKISK